MEGIRTAPAQGGPEKVGTAHSTTPRWQPHYNNLLAPVDVVLARLDRVKPAGKARWRVQCPIHDGHSLQVTEGDDGRVLLRCWGCGADADSIRQALGLEWRDLFPAGTWRPDPGRPRCPRPSRDLREQLKLDEYLVYIFLDSPGHPFFDENELHAVSRAVTRLRRYRPAFFDEAIHVYRPGDEQYGRLLVQRV